MFVCKGYCRFCGSKCRHLKVKNGEGYCKAKKWRKSYYTINDKYNNNKHISSDPNVNIKAPSWCPELH